MAIKVLPERLSRDREALKRLRDDPAWAPWIAVKEEGGATQPVGEPPGDTEDK